MFTKTVVVAGAFAALQGVSAFNEPFDAAGILGRLQNKQEVDDQCHPLGEYALGSDKAIPPCIAEQAISSICERITKFRQPGSETEVAERSLAYKQCLVGADSTYAKEIQGCLACKAKFQKLSKPQADWWSTRWTQALKDLNDDPRPGQVAWEYLQSKVVWNDYNKLATPSGGDGMEKEAIETYYKVPKPQRYGTFQLGGVSYPPNEEKKEGKEPQAADISGAIQYLDHIGQFISALFLDTENETSSANQAQTTSSAAQPTTLTRVPASKFPISSNGTMTTTTSTAASTQSATADNKYLQAPFQRDVIHNFKWTETSCTTFTYFAIIKTPMRVADSQPKPATEQDMQRLKDATHCVPCQQKIDLKNPERKAAQEKQPASPLCTKLMETVEKTGDIQQMQQILHAETQPDTPLQQIPHTETKPDTPLIQTGSTPAQNKEEDASAPKVPAAPISNKGNNEKQMHAGAPAPGASAPDVPAGQTTGCNKTEAKKACFQDNNGYFVCNFNPMESCKCT